MAADPAALPGVERSGRTIGLRAIAVRFGRHGLEVGALKSYLQLLGGAVFRLGVSLLYFLALTHALSIADFGFFASSMAVGLVLARVVAFGYGDAMFQISAGRPRTLGPYLGIYLVWFAASLPVCLLAAMAIYGLSFGDTGRFGAYLVIVATEVVLWRPIDVVSIINSGLGRFGFATGAYSIGSICRALGALLFLRLADHDVGHWAVLYAAASALALVLDIVLLMPRVRPRLRRNTVLLRWRGALALAGSGFASTGQNEIDKVLVLAFGGEVTAGLYAICIRIIDITAVPIRAFNVVMIQRVIKNPRALPGWKPQALVEAAIAAVSTLAFLAIIAMLWVFPDLLGHEVARAAGLFGLLWAVPALRNLIEYQAELLYAYNRWGTTFLMSLAVAVVKSLLMAAVFWLFGRGLGWAHAMNGLFLAAYAVSAVITFGALAAPRRRLAGVPR